MCPQTCKGDVGPRGHLLVSSANDHHPEVSQTHKQWGSLVQMEDVQGTLGCAQQNKVLRHREGCGLLYQGQ